MIYFQCLPPPFLLFAMFVFTVLTPIGAVTLESDVVDQIINSRHYLDENQWIREDGKAK